MTLETDDWAITLVSSNKLQKRDLKGAFATEPKAIADRGESKDAIGNPRWTYICTFDLEESIDSYYFLVDRFCKLFEGDAYIDAGLIRRDLPDPDVVKDEHLEIPLKYFSLGRWVDFSNYIERFTTVVEGVKHVGSRMTSLMTSFYHDRRYLEIYFRHRLFPEELSKNYKLHLSYDDIEEIVIKRNVHHKDMFYNVQDRREPMDLFIKFRNISLYKWADLRENPYLMGFDGPWIRHAKFGSEGDHTFCDNVAQMRVLNFQLSAEGPEVIYSFLSKARVPFVFAKVNRKKLPSNVQPVTCDDGNEDVRYALACLQNIRPEISIKLHLNEKLKDAQQLVKSYAQEDSVSLINALYAVYTEATKNISSIDFLSVLPFAYKKARSGHFPQVLTQSSMPNNIYLVKKATLTPSKFTLDPPVAVRCSPLLRKCSKNLMLIDIRDEDGSRLNLENDADATELIQFGIGGRIAKGLRVCGRAYHLLGSSKVHYGEFGFWAYASTDKKKKMVMSDVLESLEITGSLQEQMEKFTILSTGCIGSVPIESSWVTEINDEPNKKGIGRISRSAFEHILEECDITLKKSHSAIRVIHGGRIGILSIDPNLSGTAIVYRVSQKAFHSSDTQLYVVDVNEQEDAILDKLHICMLTSSIEGARVMSEEFLLDATTDIIHCGLSIASGGSQKLEDEIRNILPDIPIKDVNRNGYDSRRDRFFRTVLRASHLKRLKLLSDLNFTIDGVKSFMPVVDEYSVLRENEIYLNFVDDKGDSVELEGGILLGRLNSVSVDDFGVFKAVTGGEVSKALAHLTNVVVFSAKAPQIRKFANNESYADTENVIAFLNQRYDAQMSALPECRILEMEDRAKSIEQHLVQVFKILSWNNFDEGIIVSADIEIYQGYSAQCIHNGILRRISEDHFMGRSNFLPMKKVEIHPSFLPHSKLRYSSSKPLGTVWDKVRFIDIDSASSMSVEEEELVQQEDLIIEGSEDFAESAAKDMKVFQKHMISLSALYGVSPDEILSGCVYSLAPSRYTRRYVRNLESIIGTHVRYLKKLCARQFKRKLKDQSGEECLKKISAYIKESWMSPENGGFALPWMLSEQVIELLEKCNLEPKYPPRTPIREKLLFDVQRTSERGALSSMKVTISIIVAEWTLKNEKRLHIKEDDREYFHEKLTSLVRPTIEDSWHEDWSSGQDKLDAVLNDPTSFFASFLRNIYKKISDSISQTKISHQKDVMRGLEALLANAFVKIAASCSFEPMTNGRELIESKRVYRRLLFPLDSSQNGYKAVIRSNNKKYREFLINYSNCDYVAVNSFLTNSREEFEEIIAEGEWYSVEYLHHLLLTKNYRLTISRFLEVSDGYDGDNGAYALFDD